MTIAAKCTCTRERINGVPPGDCNLLDHRVEAKRAATEEDTGLGTTRGMWQLVSGLLDDERLPQSMNIAIAALCAGTASVCTVACSPVPARGQVIAPPRLPGCTCTAPEFGPDADCLVHRPHERRSGEDRRADAAYNHPAHYGGDTTYEAIKVILAWGLGFCLGNAAKYICRAGRKGGGMAKRIEDLKKARWYIDYEIRMLEAEHNEN